MGGLQAMLASQEMPDDQLKTIWGHTFATCHHLPQAPLTWRTELIKPWAKIPLSLKDWKHRAFGQHQRLDFLTLPEPWTWAKRDCQGQGRKMALGALSPQPSFEPHIPTPSQRDLVRGVPWPIWSLSFVVKGRCRLEEGRPQSGEQRRPGFGRSYLPKNDLRLLSAKQKSISHTDLVKPPNVFWMEFCFSCTQPTPLFEVGCFASRTQFHFLFLEVLACVKWAFTQVLKRKPFSSGKWNKVVPLQSWGKYIICNNKLGS